ncbi:MAG: hypothetical protein LBC83_04275 [Oscillospiraceae bacterium]|jgi:hypothetical protein|nr:hypothetical protein [Oscillospiraceae bacterium]
MNTKIFGDKKRLIAAGSAALGFLLAAGLTLFFLLPPKATGEPPQFKLPSGGEDALKIAVLSDSLLGGENGVEGGAYYANTRAALSLCKQQGVSAILYAGGMVANASAKNYAIFRALAQEVYGEATAPPMLVAMSRAELKSAASHAIAQRAFTKALEQPLRAHASIGKVQLIAVSADATRSGTSAYSEKTIKWLEAALTAAAEAAKGSPIFVLAPDAEFDGMQALHPLLAKHPNVIAISGGSHLSQLDARMLTQSSFTSVGSQGLSFVVDYSDGDFNPTQAATRAEDAPFALIFAFSRNKLNIQRWNAAKQRQESELSAWSLFLPLRTETFTYTQERRPQLAPYFATQEITAVDDIAVQGDTTKLDGVVFTAATDDERVAAYEIEAINRLNISQTRRYATDSYLGSSAAAQVCLALDPALPSGVYTVRVYAVDDFKNRSAAYLETRVEHKQQ